MSVFHKDLTGDDLHIPKNHASSHGIGGNDILDSSLIPFSQSGFLADNVLDAFLELPSFYEQISNKNQPDGYAGLDENGDLIGIFIPRQETATTLDTVVLENGEIATTSDTKDIRIGDGGTAGGASIYNTTIPFISTQTSGDAIKGVTGTGNAIYGEASTINGWGLYGNSLCVSGRTQFEPSTTQSISAGTGITSTMIRANTLIRIQGSGGAVDITANPQVAAYGDGIIIILQGDSDTNTVKFDDGTGLSLASSCTLKKGDTLTLIMDSGDNNWKELCRTVK